MALTEEIANKVIENALDLARNMKEEVLKVAENPVVGINPLLIVGYGENIEDGGGIAEMVLDDLHPTDALPMMLSDMYSQGHLNNWSWICLVVEAFIDTDQENMNRDDYERGTAQKDFETNPFTKVKEAMLATIFTIDKDVFGGYQTFVLGDNGEPKYDEVEVQEKDALRGGAIPFIFHSFADFCHMKEVERQAKNN